jgi:flagellar hook protein FlgE
VQGDVQTASVSTYMAINGNGFFVVQKPGSFSDNQPVFSGVDNYTRRGDFALDKNGYLVNGAGYYVEGVPIDPATGNMTGSVPQVLKFANDFLPAVPTSVVSYRANLASYPLTTKHDNSIPGSELLQPADFAFGNPRTLGTPATPYGDATITGAAKNNKLTSPTAITTSTLLSGGTNTNSLTTISPAPIPLPSTSPAAAPLLPKRSRSTIRLLAAALAPRPIPPISILRRPPSAICSRPSTDSPGRHRNAVDDQRRRDHAA